MELQSDLSKEYIADALILLMETKPFDKITNKDITDKAGLSHITIYRNFKSKEDILKFYLTNKFNESKKAWDENQNIAFNIFTFFQMNKDVLDLVYKSNLEHLLIDNFLACFDYSEDDINIIAYSKVYVAYLHFGWCNEWYKRGMTETPEEMSKLFELGKSN